MYEICLRHNHTGQHNTYLPNWQQRQGHLILYFFHLTNQLNILKISVVICSGCAKNRNKRHR